MAASSQIHPLVSAQDRQGKFPFLACWQDDLNQFDRKHLGYTLLRDPLYALPSDLLCAVKRELPRWLTPAEITFEEDLTALCSRHHSIGIFHDRPVTASSLLNRPGHPILADCLFQQLGWDRYMTIENARKAIEACFGLLDPLHERSMAYVGWLLTYPSFLAERDQLRFRWERVVKFLGGIPTYPVRAATDNSQEGPPPEGNDVLNEFITDFNNFYERWQLRGLITWDLPEPCGANLTGLELPSNLPPTISRFRIDVPTALRLPANFPLRGLLEELQRAQTPDHLQPWLDTQDQQHENGLGHGRFGTMFQLAFYRDTALASRYSDRFGGSIERLDHAFADFLDVGTDSVKKVRLTMSALRNRHE